MFPTAEEYHADPAGASERRLGHPIWDAALLQETAERYPELDLEPWRAAL